ncbi:MAG: hypothetical protein IPP74_01350 [Alphaproteobacteria bacterium]|nr:hypothetical protein [Alphaproteobacteria bacterium]
MLLEQECIKTNRPIFIVQSPDDLVCSSPSVKQQDGIYGLIVSPPSGPLVDFLNTYKDQRPVLVVNYDSFQADEIVQFNSLLDKVRHVDGFAIPKDTLVLGLINGGNPLAYRGADFLGRFDSRTRCRLTAQQFDDSVSAFMNGLWYSEEDTVPYVIDLFNTPYWKEQLLGTWQIHGNQLIFKEGELAAALASKQPIELRNAPFHKPEFVHFWQQAQLRHKIEHDGRVIPLEDPLVILAEHGYNWEWLNNQILSTYEHKYTLQEPLLNPTSFNSFFSQYQYDEKEQSLHTLPGLIEQHCGGVLPVILTRTLTNDQVSRLLSECHKHQVQL